MRHAHEHNGEMTITVLQNDHALSGNSASLILTVAEDVETFANARNQWNELVTSTHATAYQTWEWLYYWWKYFGDSSKLRLHLLFFRHEDLLVGIMPLCTTQTLAGGVLLQRTLRFLGSGSAYSLSSGMFLDNGPSDFLDAIVAKGYEERIARAFISYLEEHAEVIDSVELVNLPEDGYMMTHVVPNISSREFVLVKKQADICPRLPVPDSMTDYLKKLSSSTRRRFSQALKAGREDGKFSIHTADDKHRVLIVLKELIKLHQHRWNSLGYPGLFMDNRFTEFQHEVAVSFFENGWLWCKWAETDGTCIAARLGFQFNGVIADYLSGFDDSIPEAKHRPGLALLLVMIEDAVLRKDRFVDFLRGDEKYKFELTSDTRYNWNVSILNIRQKGILRAVTSRGLKLFRLSVFLLRKELQLLHVQYKVHGVFSCLYHYGMFRSQRLTNKIKRLTSSKSETTAS